MPGEFAAPFLFLERLPVGCEEPVIDPGVPSLLPWLFRCGAQVVGIADAQFRVHLGMREVLCGVCTAKRVVSLAVGTVLGLRSTLFDRGLGMSWIASGESTPFLGMHGVMLVGQR